MVKEACNSNLPIFLYGHSMGGLTVISFSLSNPHVGIAGVIATSPLLGLPIDRSLGKGKVFLLKHCSHNIEVNTSITRIL